MLLALSLAGTSLPLRVVHRAVAQGSMAQVIRALSVMETKGLVMSNGDSWQPSHDLILERMIALSTDAEQEATHAGLAEAMADVTRRGLSSAPTFTAPTAYAPTSLNE